MTGEEREGGNEPERYGSRWPPSPKMQIVLIAIGFGLFNALLLALWVIAIVMSR